jgi:hypothetical protein
VLGSPRGDAPRIKNEDRGLVRRMPPDGIAIRDRARFEALVEGEIE